jgi:hypothetical protein
METKIIQYEANNKLFIGFDGLDGWEYFIIINKVIQEHIKPEYINNKGGITDMLCEYIKDGIRFNLEFNSMTGNSIVYEGIIDESIRSSLRTIADIVLERWHD